MRESNVVQKTAPKRELKVRIPSNAPLARLMLGPTGRVVIMACACFTILALSLFMGLYVKYSKIIDEKLRVGPFANTAKIFAAPASDCGGGHDYGR